MNVIKPIGQFLKKNGPLLLTVGASAGAVVSNVLTAKAVLKAERLMNDIPEEELKTIETKKKIVSVYIPPAVAAVGTISCIVGAYVANKKIQAGLITALGTVTNMFNVYRLKNEPETDQQIMTEIALEQIPADDIQEQTNNTAQLWTDPYISSLTKGSVKYYAAEEADILRAAMWTKDHFSNDGYANLGMFYDVLRDCGVDLPRINGEDDVAWENNDEWWDWYGHMILDFNYAPATNTGSGITVNVIDFPLTVDEMRTEDENMTWFVESLAKQDAAKHNL